MREHTTEMTLEAPGTHQGTDAIISAIVDKLGDLSHRCALLTKVEMKIEWLEGGTYETCLTNASVRDSHIDSEQGKRNFRVRNKIAEFIQRFREDRGNLEFYASDLDEIMNTLYGIILDGYDYKYNIIPEWMNAPLTVDKVNWLFLIMSINYRIDRINDSMYAFVEVST